MNHQPITRRSLLTGSALCGGLILADITPVHSTGPGAGELPEGSPAPASSSPAARRLPDLAPAEWIWYPSGRTLQNTFILFRREVNLASKPRARRRLDRGGQPISARGQRQADPVWAGAGGSKVDGGRSRRSDRRAA